jgi:hypothetical protein
MRRSGFYAKSWFRSKKQPTELWTSEQARAAHLSRTLYTVLVDSPERPSCFLEVTDKFVGVGFLDDSLREYLTYGLNEVEPGRLFLKSFTYREFVGGSGTVKFGATFVFHENGTVRISKQSFNPHVAEEAESRVDVKDHYFPWPEFGEYDRLIDIQKLELFPPLS